MTHYLSGPMTGLPDLNFPTFARAAEQLRARGLTVLSAHEICHPETAPGSLPWSSYLRTDLGELLRCDALILLRGWPSSKGARLELSVAVALGMPISFYDFAAGLVAFDSPESPCAR